MKEPSRILRPVVFPFAIPPLLSLFDINHSLLSHPNQSSVGWVCSPLELCRVSKTQFACSDEMANYRPSQARKEGKESMCTSSRIAGECRPHHMMYVGCVCATPTAQNFLGIFIQISVFYQKV